MDFPPPQFFQHRGHRIAYVDEGTGPVLLMVHGNPTWSFYWRAVFRAFAPSHRCIAIDHVGCGRSDKPGDDRYLYTLASRIEDLQALVEHLELADVTLAVHDWGGAIGMGWAVRNPELVKALVVTNTAAFHLPSGKAFPPALALARVPGLGAALVRGANAFVRGTTRWGVTRPLDAATAAAYRAPYGTWKERIAVHRFVQDIPLRPADPAYAVIEEIAAGLPRLRDKPMLIAWGLRDFVFDAAFLREWEQRFPSAEVHRFPEAGHLVLEDAREPILAALKPFLARTRTEGA